MLVKKNKITAVIYINDKYYTITDTEDILAFEKYNVVVTYNGKKIMLYVNGKLKNNINIEGTIIDSDKLPITIGANPEVSGNKGLFNGNVYDVKVYKKALSVEEISKYYIYARQTFNTPGITPTYTYRMTNRVLDMDSRKANSDGTTIFSGSTTNTWYDLAQSTNRELKNFAYNRTSGWDYNGGLIFDGSGDYVSCGKAKNLDGTKALTMSATVKVSAVTSNFGYIVSDAESGGYGLRVSTNSKITGMVYVTNEKAYKIIYTPVIEIDKIYNVIFTFDGTNLRIFLNGVEGTPITLTSEDTIKDVDIYNLLGGNPSSKNVPSGEYFKGVIYDVKIYDAVLSDSEIQQLWGHQNHQYGIQK